MNAARHGPLRNVMIPWIITLVALFGWNAFAVEHGRIRKGDAMEGVGLSQIADEPELPGRVANPQVLAPPCTSSFELKPDAAGTLALISNCRSLQLRLLSEGAVRGRAPPAAGTWLMA